jgi:CubicO group peptidase (beta-lactamase class C family)
MQADRTRQSNPAAVSRRKLLRTAAGVTVAAAVERLTPSPARAAEGEPASRSVRNGAGADGALLRALDEKIEAAMARYNIPGVAVGLVHNGHEYVRGYGVTNVKHPSPVDGDTLFRIGSTTKTFTGTAVMRLVDQGKLDLNAPVRTYLPELKLADESVAARVTVRQLLNHSAGWLGDDYADYGRGADALARYVAGMLHLPQFTEPGRVFAYNNAAVNLAERVIEAVSGMSYETAMQQLLLDPLGLTRTGFFTDALVGYDIAVSHTVENRVPVVEPSAWLFPRSLHSTGRSHLERAGAVALCALPSGRRHGARWEPAAFAPLAASDALRPWARRHDHDGDRRGMRDVVAAPNRGGCAGLSTRWLVGRPKLRLLRGAAARIRDDRTDQFDDRSEAHRRTRAIRLGAAAFHRTEQPARSSEGLGARATRPL